MHAQEYALTGVIANGMEYLSLKKQAFPTEESLVTVNAIFLDNGSPQAARNWLTGWRTAITTPIREAYTTSD